MQADRFDVVSEVEREGSIKKYRILEQGQVLSYRSVLELWERDEAFVDTFIHLLKSCGYSGYRWETPPITSETAQRDFEFVLHKEAPPRSPPDRAAYAAYFDDAREGFVAFENLGKDALLVVPVPDRPDADYAKLAHFLREAPVAQQRALWRELARRIQERLSSRPLWVSVAGGGVNWLHIRLDKAPKYYRYRAYAAEG